MKTAITVGVVGFPNVGKSSIINSLKRTQAVSVQATPCITKVMQEIELDRHVKLLDCPGIFVSTSEDNVASAALRNLINVHELSVSTAPGKSKIELHWASFFLVNRYWQTCWKPTTCEDFSVCFRII